MEKNWNAPDHYTKPEIDEACKKLVENRVKVQLTSIELIRMLQSDDECRHYEKFYATILEAILNEEEVGYPEKEQFLILHKSLIQVYNENQKLLKQ